MRKPLGFETKRLFVSASVRGRRAEVRHRLTDYSFDASRLHIGASTEDVAHLVNQTFVFKVAVFDAREFFEQAALFARERGRRA